MNLKSAITHSCLLLLLSQAAKEQLKEAQVALQEAEDEKRQRDEEALRRCVRVRLCAQDCGHTVFLW